MMRFPSLTASYASCKIQIGYLEQRLAERDITLEVTDAALDLLGEAGFDPIYGARPLKRAIQQDLENRLAQDILAGKIGPDDVVTADVKDRRIVFSVIAEAK